MSDWDLLIDRKDLRRTEVRQVAAPALEPGEVRLAVERFSLTANNITYGLIGDAFGYWKFFPAPAPFGRIPAWGFATVTESAAADVPVGLRIFGYLPMSTAFTARLVKGRDGFVDASPHRAELPPTYNAYAEAPADALDDHRALLRPLFMTSFLLDDFLAEDASLKTLVLSSASSKTAMGLAWLARRRGVKVVGLTSAANRERLAALDLYDTLVTYPDAGGLRAEGPAAYVDFAGDRAVTTGVHKALGADLARSLIVGGTHWEARADAEPPPGPQPVLFFAPDQIRKRAKDWGMAELDTRFMAAMRAFVAASPWLQLVHHRGVEGLQTAYQTVLEGRARPEDGHIIRLG
jgi:NADPH:quinone reductase-like Zn-dependent oxidoreductase